MRVINPSEKLNPPRFRVTPTPTQSSLYPLVSTRLVGCAPDTPGEESEGGKGGSFIEAKPPLAFNHLSSSTGTLTMSIQGLLLIPAVENSESLLWSSMDDNRKPRS